MGEEILFYQFFFLHFANPIEIPDLGFLGIEGSESVVACTCPIVQNANSLTAKTDSAYSP